MPRYVVQAAEHIDETKPVIDAAHTIGSLVATRLAAGDDVVIALRGVRGVSSSFFNVVIAAAFDVIGTAIGSERLLVETDNRTQREVFERSLTAFMNRS